MERDKVWEVSLLQDSFQRCLSFLFCFFAKATCRLQAFHLSEVQGNRIEIYNRNVVKKKKKKDKFHLPSNMDMKILQNEDLCYFKNSGIDQCCVIFQFLISLSVSTDYLYVLSCDFMFSVSDAVCSLSCTHTHKKKMWILSQEGQGSRYQLHHF